MLAQVRQLKMLSDCRSTLLLLRILYGLGLLRSVSPGTFWYGQFLTLVGQSFSYLILNPDPFPRQMLRTSFERPRVGPWLLMETISQSDDRVDRLMIYARLCLGDKAVLATLLYLIKDLWLDHKLELCLRDAILRDAAIGIAVDI